VCSSDLNRPLVVNSGYRCENRNVAVGGSATSRHLIGCAADIATPRGLLYNTEFVGIVKRLSGSGWEIVTYPCGTYIHIAVPRDYRFIVWVRPS
jgi:uncharacterized protein YcbK (DUF882 family)